MLRQHFHPTPQRRERNMVGAKDHPFAQCTNRTANVKPQSTDDADTDVPMGRSPAERLTASRIRAGFATRESAVDAFGWQLSAYNHHESDRRGFSVDQAKRYGRAFKVSPAWLLALEPDVGEPAEMIELPSDEILAALITPLLEAAIPGRVPSEDLVRELVERLRSTLATLPKVPGASTDPLAARMLALGLTVRS